MNLMHVVISRVGGFAGITRTSEFETAELPPAKRRTVEAAISALTESEPVSSGPDRFTYGVTVEGTEGLTRTVHVGEQDIPPALKDLLAEIRRKGSVEE